jgi:hypothetical protein
MGGFFGLSRVAAPANISAALSVLTPILVTGLAGTLSEKSR